jgi:hypothetical protein
MNHNFKPGDLALIVGARKYPQNIGLTCELVEYLGVGQVSAWRDPADNRSVLNIASAPCWLVVGDDLVSGIENTKGACLALQSHLMPLLGDLAPAEQKSQAVPV